MRDVEGGTRRAFSFVCAIACALTLLGTGAALAGCGQSQSVGSSPSASPSSAQAEQAVYDYTQAVAKNATVAHLLLQADAPLAADVKGDDIVLGGAFSGFTASDVERVDDTTLSLTIALPNGTEVAEAQYGYVDLTEAAFAKPHEDDHPVSSSAAASNQTADDLEETIGQTIAVSVSDPLATVLPKQGSYSADKKEFLLPITLKYAEFRRAPQAADFSLADESLPISAVDYDGSSLTDATLHIDASVAASPREAFDALDAALTSEGITVVAAATNCGDVVIGSDEMRVGERDGLPTTALACLAAQPVAHVESTYAIESKTQDGDDATDYDVQLKTSIDTAPGVCLLPEQDIDQAVEVDYITGGDEGQVLGEDVIRIDDSHLFLNAYMSGKTIDAVSAADGETALKDAQEVAAQFARAHTLVLAPGVLRNAWDIPEPRTEVAISLAEDLSQNSGANARDDESFRLIEEAYAAESSSAASDSASAGSSASSSSAPSSSSSAPSSSAPSSSSSADSSSASASSAASDSSSASSSAPADFDPEAERAAYANSDSTDVETIVAPSESQGVDNANATVDYSTFNATNDDDEDAKKAREAFKAMAKILETAGAFAEGMDGDPGGYLEGIGGLFGFISMAVGWGDGDLLSLSDVMDKLNVMDGEIRAIDSKIDQLSTQLADVEKNLGYHEDLNTLRACINQTEIYGSTLEADIWNKDVDWKYDETKGFDGLNDKQKAQLEKFLDDIDGIQSTYGYNAAADTLKLGNLIVGDPSLIAKSVVQEYDDCIDTMFNWEPETYVYRELYRARLMYAYICGYTTAVTQLQYTAYKSGDKDKYEQALKALTDNYQKVQEAMQGKATYAKGQATQIEESDLAAATHARADGRIKNLVTGSLLGTYLTPNPLYGPPMGSEELLVPCYPNGLDDFCHHCSEPDQVSTYKLDSVFSEGNFKTMVGRLGNTKYSCLYDEIIAVTGCDIGFVYGNNSVECGGCAIAWEHAGLFSTEEITASERPSDKEKENPRIPYGRIVTSSAERHTVHDQASVRHTYSWTADYFDLNDNSPHYGAEIYSADQKYNVGGAHWEMLIDFNYYYAMHLWEAIPDD